MFSLSADIWSVGVLLLHMLPCEGGERSRPSPEMPVPFLLSRLRWKQEEMPGVLELLEACLQRSPTARPGIGKLREIKI